MPGSGWAGEIVWEGVNWLEAEVFVLDSLLEDKESDDEPGLVAADHPQDRCCYSSGKDWLKAPVHKKSEANILEKWHGT